MKANFTETKEQAYWQVRSQVDRQDDVQVYWHAYRQVFGQVYWQVRRQVEGNISED